MTDFIEKVQNGDLQSRYVKTDVVHITMATVGKYTIEAEYFTFERGLGLNEPNWTLWDKITIPFYRARHWIRDTYWEIRYGFQRMFNGYDSVDTFGTFTKFIDRYSKILTDYRKCHYGYPGTMTEEEWDAIVDEMIYHLKYMDEETVIEELEKDVPDDWSASWKTVNFVLEQHKDAFFELFSKYFYHLWD